MKSDLWAVAQKQLLGLTKLFLATNTQTAGEVNTFYQNNNLKPAGYDMKVLYLKRQQPWLQFIL